MNAVRAERGRRAVFWVALGAAVIAVALVGGRPNRGGPPLDPTSTGPLGAKGLVLLLRELGAEVEVADRVGDGAAAAAVLRDTLTDGQRDDLRDWVRSGGVLLVADPGSPLAPGAAADAFGVEVLDALEPGPVLARRCASAGLDQVDEIQPPAGVPLQVPSGGTGCFPHQGGHLVVVTQVGAGEVVAIGGGAVLMNASIGDADNAALAASVLAPRAGGRVTILRAAPVGAGDRSLSDLIGPRVKATIWQLVIAFAFVVLWRARRLGRPVPDPQPVQIAGSELVVAVGHLLQRGRHRDRAAEVISGDLRRTLAERLGLHVSAPDDVVVDAVSTHTGLDRGDIAAALTPHVGSDAALVEFAQLTEKVRQEVVHAP